MSHFSAYSPVTHGEVLHKILDKIKFGWVHLCRTKNTWETLNYSLQLDFRKGEIPLSEEAVRLAKDILQKMKAAKIISGIPGVDRGNANSRYKLKGKNALLFDDLISLVGAQVEEPQYPWPKIVWGKPFYLADERMVVQEILAKGHPRHQASGLLKEIERRRPLRYEPGYLKVMLPTACYQVEAGILLAENGEIEQALELLLRALLVFLNTRFLWWRKAIVEYVTGKSVLMGKLKSDLAVRLFLEENERQKELRREIEVFNKKTMNIFSQYVDADWLNAQP